MLFQTDAESFIPKKIVSRRCQYQNEKVLFTDPIFSEDFGLDSYLSIPTSTHSHSCSFSLENANVFSG